MTMEIKYFNRLMMVASIVFVVIFIITMSFNYIIIKNSDGKIYDSLDSIKPAEVDLLDWSVLNVPPGKMSPIESLLL